MNASMFGKNDESISSSTRTKQKKDTYLYRSRNNNQHIIMSDSNTKITQVKNYDTFLSTIKGYNNCSDLSCNYITYLDSSKNKIIPHTIDDWNVTIVDYSGVQLDASNNPVENSEMLGGTNWPYTHTRGGEDDCGMSTDYFVNTHTYLHTDVSNNAVATLKGTGSHFKNNKLIYAKNKLFQFPRTNLTQ